MPPNLQIHHQEITKALQDNVFPHIVLAISILKSTMHMLCYATVSNA